MNKKRILAALLCALILTPAIASCSEKKVDEGNTTLAAQESETQAETEYDPLADLNFEGKKFRIYTSTNNPGGVGNSNYLIEGPEESTGEVVNDSALQRNMRVEEKLTVDLEFTQVDLMYTGVATEMRKLVSTADDAFDLIINDLFPIAAVVLEGAFVNAQEGEFFNFEKPYWYKDFMDDIHRPRRKLYPGRRLLHRYDPQRPRSDLQQDPDERLQHRRHRPVSDRQ